MTEKLIKGTGVALVTPFRKDGSIDFRAFEKLIEHVITGGVDFVVLLGTTAETPVLSQEEKDALVSHALEIINKRVKVVVGYGGNNTQALVNSIKDADFSGIDAILSVTPYYNKPTQKGLYAHFKAVANASKVPVILYNVPGRTGSNLSAETTLKLANDFENIIAIKEASANLDQIMQIIKNKPKEFVVLSGDDAITMPLISLGMEGVISVSANALPKQMSLLVKHSIAGDYKKAFDIHYNILDFTNLLFAEGNPAGIKAALSIKDLVENNLRLPLVPVSKTTFSALQKIWEEIK
ncbi:MAG: 4-hydroxy-tetrahydrodipicolinate synthase [Bacteroidales bacterium]|nr:4-hydroxy-tetrahydrodipicolinate synthase [Bacteroidales bacterium]